MAYVTLKSFRRCLLKVTYFRFQNILNSSTSKQTAEEETPVKFTTSKASKIPIAQLIYSPKVEKDEYKVWYKPYVILGSVVLFCVYFSMLREENKIDEILKGNYDYSENKSVELLNLKIKLVYCEKNKLPTSALKQKIKELEDMIQKGL